MILGIYLKSRPKNKWQLISVSTSPETANQDLDAVLKQSQYEGNELAETAMKTFDSAFHIPQFLSEIKSEKPQFN